MNLVLIFALMATMHYGSEKFVVVVMKKSTHSILHMETAFN